MTRSVKVIGLILLIALIALAILGYKYNSLSNSFSNLEFEFASSTQEYQSRVSSLENTLEETQTENENLEEALARERNKNQEFQNQIDDIAGSVGTLEKLAETDEELLQKYSKIYFLNEHYIPSSLSEIDSEYLYREDDEAHIHSEVLPYLEDLLEEAEEDGIDLEVVSAYRSFGEQATLKAGYVVTYGSGTANQFSAEQGYSEHQLGTTVDFTVAGTPPFSGFQNTAAYEWLLENAYEYGFTLSYPEGNAYYQFEPWHWRFVGEALAEDLHDNNRHFYDLQQREIDPYLVDIFG